MAAPLTSSWDLTRRSDACSRCRSRSLNCRVVLDRLRCLLLPRLVVSPGSGQMRTDDTVLGEKFAGGGKNGGKEGRAIVVELGEEEVTLRER